MIDIEQQAINTFQENYAYFSKEHALLFNKLNILQTAIETGQYKENYALEYINGSFDIKELNSGELLYGSSSQVHAQDVAKSVNYKKNDSVIETFYTFPFTDQNIQDLDKLTIINSYMVGTAPIVHFVNQHTSIDDEMKKIYKFMFFGVGIGSHIQEVAKKVEAGSYFIVEDNLELFRLSMFVTNYANLGRNSRMHFSIMSTPDEFKNAYNHFADELLIKSSYLKFYLFSDSYTPKIKQIQNFAVTKSHLSYPYNYLLHKNLRLSEALQNSYNFLNISKAFDGSIFDDKPVLYLAAGPSLSENIEWIKKYQENFVIIAVFMVSAILEKAGITVDIFIHVDEGRTPIEKTLAKIEDTNYFEKSIFMLAASVPLDLFGTICKKEKMFLVEDRTHYKVEHGSIEFSSVGEAGYSLALILGIKNIYLLGLDLALDQETGQTHGEGHNTESKLDITKMVDTPDQTATLRKTLITVKGNKQESVLTTPLFAMSIHMFNRSTQLYKNKQQVVYNLSSGAYFDETIPMNTADVDLAHFDRVDFNEVLIKYLNTKTTNSLSSDEKNSLIIRKNEVKKKAKAIEKFSKQKIKNIESFEKSFINLISILITPVNQELNEVSDIFLNYFQTVGSHIQAVFNTKNLKHSKQTLEELQTILSRQLYKILHDIGSFEFNYINGEKYFDVGEYWSRKSEVLDFELTSTEISQLDSWYSV